jgi:AcrR family transcriptional regulator
MSRAPDARKKVLDASRRIVEERGAGALTYDGIASVSGVTRGGITYHFPTKQSLLSALVEQDAEQWQRLEDELKPSGLSGDAAELLAVLRSWTNDRPDRRRFVAGMLTAVSLDPPILDPVREAERARIDSTTWDERALRMEIARLAASGLFWADLFGCPSIPDELRKRLVDELEKLALDWSRAPDTQTTD